MSLMTQQAAGGIAPDALADLIRARQVRVDDLAAAAGVSRSSIYRLIRGKRDPRVGELARIAGALGVDVTDLRRAA